MYSNRGLTTDRAILLMAVAAVLLAITLASSLGGGSTDARPEASFVFDTNGSDVIVTHYGGDAVDGDALYVVSRTRGSLGNVAGTDGAACERNRSRMAQGEQCRVAGGVYERLLVVWQGSGSDRLIFARRPAAPTPTRTPTPTPAPTLTPAPAQTAATPSTPTETTDDTATPALTPTASPTNATTQSGVPTDTTTGPS